MDAKIERCQLQKKIGSVNNNYRSRHRDEYNANAEMLGDRYKGFIVDGFRDCVVACQREEDRCFSVTWGKPFEKYFKERCYLLSMKLTNKPRSGSKARFTSLNMDCLDGII